VHSGSALASYEKGMRMTKIDDDITEHIWRVVAHYEPDELKNFKETPSDTHIWISLDALKGFLVDADANKELKKSIQSGPAKPWQAQSRS
jgi:hypothetical protein